MLLAGTEPVDEDEVKAAAADHGLSYVTCSALTQRGLKNVFETAIRAMLAPPPKPPKPSTLARFLRMCGLAKKKPARNGALKKRATPMHGVTNGVTMVRSQ